jgi:hypothetical protein
MQIQCLAGINGIFQKITNIYKHRRTAGRLGTEKKVITVV